MTLSNTKQTKCVTLASRDKLLTLLETLPGAFFVLDETDTIVYANASARVMLGSSLRACYGKSFWHCAPHLVSPAFSQAVRQTKQTRALTDVQYVSPVTQKWLHVQLAPTVGGLTLHFHEVEEAARRWESVAHSEHLFLDDEDQQQTKERITTREENWRVLAETVPQLVWTTRADGWADYANQRFCAYTHATPEQLQGYGWSQFLHPDDCERTLVVRAHALRTGVPYEVEYRLREGQTGDYRWFLVRGMPVRDETGQILKWFGTCTNIEEQKRTEHALRQSQERMRALIDSNIIGIVSVEVDGEVIVEANEAFLHMTGYSREEVRSRTLNRVKITPPDQAPLFERVIQEVTTRGQHTPVEAEVVCKDGGRLPIVCGGVLLQDQPRQMVSFLLDNSARKELEQRKDTFISMASHELKTPLTALKLQTTLLRRQLARHGIQYAVPALASMETQLNKVDRLVGELLDVSKIQAGRMEYRQESVDLNALLSETVETMQQSSLSHTIVVRGAVQASLLGDRDRLGQVFTNLLSNAIKYSPDSRTVEIDLSTSEDAVTVCVRDHGLGIPREQLDRIFDRFYRIPDLNQRAIPGLGMGLYIVAEIVKHHGGTITVDSALGKGSTFTVTLPHTRDV
jgi:PAS domain S-box-containing protein